MRGGRNWIGGEWKRAVSGLDYEAPGDGGERYPRSGEKDLLEALAHARREAPTWAACEPRERRQRLLEFGDELLDRIEGSEAQADLHVLGLEGLALERHVPSWEEVTHWCRPPTARRDARGRAEGSRRGPDVRGVRPHWTELWRGACAEVLSALATERVVLWMPDPRLPGIGDAFARAAEDAELPAGAFQVLHGEGHELLAAFARQRAGPLGIGAPRSAAEHVRRFLGPDAGCLEVRPLLDRTFVVTEADDPAAAAERVVRRAFGAGACLGGWRAGRAARVVVALRSLSRFTEELLACLEEAEDDGLALDPGFAPRPGELDALHRLRRLGLDEGATLIHEAAAPGTPRRGSSRSARSGATLTRLVFTNVEPDSALAAWREPLPILSLLRAPESARGASRPADAWELARRLDALPSSGKNEAQPVPPRSSRSRPGAAEDDESSGNPAPRSSPSGTPDENRT